MTVIRMSVATVTASLPTKISLCVVRVYNHHLGHRMWHCNHFIKPAGRPFSCGHTTTKFEQNSGKPGESYHMIHDTVDDTEASLPMVLFSWCFRYKLLSKSKTSKTKS